MFSKRRLPGAGFFLAGSCLALATFGFHYDSLNDSDSDNLSLSNDTELAISNEAKLLAIDLGFSPEALVLADVTLLQAEELLWRIDRATDLRANLADGQKTLEDYATTMTSTIEALQLDPSNDDMQQQFTRVSAGFQATQSSIDALYVRFRELATSELLPPAIVAEVQRNNARHRFDCAPELRANPGDDLEMRAVSEAERSETRALRRGEAVDQADQDLLARIRNDQKVVQAKGRYDARNALMVALFEMQ